MKTIDDYLASLPEEQKNMLQHVYEVVRSAVPEAEESISYGMPAFKYKKKPLIYFAAFKDHCSVFPTSGPIQDLADDLKEFTVTKGTIHFNKQQPLPDALLKKILLYRVSQIDSK